MTREEAKQIISDIDHAWRSFTEEEYVALDMAIEALSAELCEDCISRAEVMKLSQHKPEYGDMIYAFDVSILPSVQPINQNIKALGEELRIFRGGIKDEKVLTGFNMAITLCNKHLAESEDL